MQIFAGEDTYASYHAARLAAKKSADKATRELVVVDAGDTTAAQLAGFVSGASLFDSGKYVLLKRPHENTDILMYLQQLAGRAADQVCVWVDAKPDYRQKMIKHAKQAGYLFDFPKMSESKLALWVTKYAGELELKLGSSLVQILIEICGEDRWRIDSELHKLVIYTESSSQQVDEVVLRQLIGSEVSGDIWHLLDSLGGRRKQPAIRELDKLLRHEDSSQYVIAMLSREIGLLARVKMARNAADLKLHPYVLEKTRKKAAHYSWQKIKQLSLMLMRLDYTIKSGRIDPALGLSMYLLVW